MEAKFGGLTVMARVPAPPRRRRVPISTLDKSPKGTLPHKPLQLKRRKKKEEVTDTIITRQVPFSTLLRISTHAVPPTRQPPLRSHRMVLAGTIVRHFRYRCSKLCLLSAMVKLIAVGATATLLCLSQMRTLWATSNKTKMLMGHSREKVEKEEGVNGGEAMPMTHPLPRRRGAHNRSRGFPRFFPRSIHRQICLSLDPLHPYCSLLRKPMPGRAVGMGTMIRGGEDCQCFRRTLLLCRPPHRLLLPRAILSDVRLAGRGARTLGCRSSPAHSDRRRSQPKKGAAAVISNWAAIMTVMCPPFRQPRRHPAPRRLPALCGELLQLDPSATALRLRHRQQLERSSLGRQR